MERNVAGPAAMVVRCFYSSRLGCWGNGLGNVALGVAPREGATAWCRLSGCLCCEGDNVTHRVTWLGCQDGGLWLGYEAVRLRSIAAYLWAADVWATGPEGGEGGCVGLGGQAYMRAAATAYG